MSGSEQLELGGRALWAYVVELDGGLRVRFALDDWLGVSLYRGQRVTVRRPGKQDESLFVTEAVELPPIVWVVFANRIRAAS